MCGVKLGRRESTCSEGPVWNYRF